MPRRGYLSIKNWRQYQHYAKRNAPWLKLHRRMLDDYEFSQLPDAQKWHYIGLLILALTYDNELPTDVLFLEKQIHATDKLDLSVRFFKKHVLANCSHRASKALASCKQNGVSETETETDPPKPPRKGASGFEEFWKAYPKKRSKGHAERAWSKLQPTEQLQGQILAALARAKTSVEWVKERGRFIPYPATWLNARGWEDDYGEPDKVSGSHARVVL